MRSQQAPRRLCLPGELPGRKAWPSSILHLFYLSWRRAPPVLRPPPFPPHPPLLTFLRLRADENSFAKRRQRTPVREHFWSTGSVARSTHRSFHRLFARLGAANQEISHSLPSGSPGL